MDVLRTPDDRFVDLPGYPFPPNYERVADGEGGELRMHYLDEGPPDRPPVLLMHGEPSWSFLYRHMIPPLVAAGHRVVAPDLVGFGRSDKPTEPGDHTYPRQVEWTRELLFDRLDLHDITLFAQDWGGLIGLRLVAAEPERFARVAVGNTGLPTGAGTPPDAFLAWQKYARETPTFPAGRIVDGATTTELTDEVIAGYDAPFPDETFKAGARVLPSLVPTTNDDPSSAANKAAWEVLAHFTKPFLVAFSDEDPITRGGERPFLSRIPGTQGQPHTAIDGGGHFLQEDRGPELAQVLLDFIST